MYYYKTLIQYDGTDFAGFQWQKNIPTIQREINIALDLILNCKFTTMSASRTDSGVHARDQIVKICTISPIDCTHFVETFNKLLPSQIKCLNISSCDGLFKPATDSLSKEYRYLFTNKIQASQEDSRFISNISNQLNFKLIDSCIEALIGEHDFCNFYSSGSNVKSTIRNILNCELDEINPHDILLNSDIFKIPTTLTHCYQLKIEANGFLKQMIRHIVSSLWMVGSEKLSLQEFKHLLNGPKTLRQNWKVAPPNGLILFKIYYPPPSSSQSNNL